MVRMSDVAKLAGVSKSTVSRVLNQSGYTTEETRRKVYEAIEKTGYKVNLVARSLTKSETHTIGFLVPNSDDEMYYKLIQKIEQILTTLSYRIIICHTQYEYEKEKSYVESLIQNHVDGLIVLTSTANAELYKNINKPIILFDQYISGGPITITSDHFYGGYIAAKKLYENQVTDVLVINQSNLDVAYQERINGFKKAAEENAMNVDIITCAEPYEKYVREIEKAFRIKPFHGIFATNDLLAAYALNACLQMGLHVPQDVKIIGYGDTKISQITNPTLTTISQNIDKLAETTVKQLMSSLQKKPIRKRFIILPIKMIEKNSTIQQ